MKNSNMISELQLENESSEEIYYPKQINKRNIKKEFKEEKVSEKISP
jgi:hypothetical protein